MYKDADDTAIVPYGLRTGRGTSQIQVVSKAGADDYSDDEDYRGPISFAVWKDLAPRRNGFLKHSGESFWALPHDARLATVLLLEGSRQMDPVWTIPRWRRGGDLAGVNKTNLLIDIILSLIFLVSY